MPIFRRIPKRGFSNAKFRTVYEIINLATLHDRFDDGETVDLDALKKLRLIRGHRRLVKVLGGGELGKRLTVEVHRFSEAARAAIERAGGTAKVLERRSPQEAARAKRNTAKRVASGGDQPPTANPSAEC